MSLVPGQILDNKYRIVRLIGEGGMGSVHEGENTLIARRVAIKVMHAAAAANEQALQRFEREAQAAGRIGSDHILEVLDMGRLEGGDRYMVLEYLDGEPLAARIERFGRMTPEQIGPLMRQALKGLQAAHDAGIIHRDLKPDNIFILREKAGQPDYVKIIDFGISKFSALDTAMNMTRTGAVMGTPYYMSPEQAKGSSQVDPRSDVYAIGVIMYEAVTGRVPFDGNTFNELMFKIVLSEPPNLSEAVPDLDPAFAAIINKAMARELEGRYASAQQLRQAIDDYLGGVRQSQVAVAVPANLAAAPGVAAAVVNDTGATWANTNADMVVPKKPGAGLVAAAVLGGLLVLGGGAFAAMKLLGGSADSADAALAAAPSASASALAAHAAVPAKSVAPPVSEPAPVPAAHVEPAPTPSAAPEPPAPEPAASVAPQTTSAKRAVAAAPARPAPRPAAQSKPAPTLKVKSKSTDFGY